MIFWANGTTEPYHWLHLFEVTYFFAIPYHYPDPKIQKKLEVVYLKSQSLQHQEICRICRICKTTLSSYLRQYQEGGLERLKETHYVGQANELEENEVTLKAYFEAHPPQTSAEARAAVEKLTGIQRSPTQIRAFMRRIGMRCRKVGVFVQGGSLGVLMKIR